MHAKLAASLVVTAVAACGQPASLPDAGNPIDATTIDGAIDAPAIDSAPGGTVQVTVYRRDDSGLTEANVPVLWMSNSGEVVGRAMTNANGVASGVVPAGGMVTVVQSENLMTFIAVEAGDQLVVASPQLATTTGTTTFTLPTGPVGTTQYRVTGRCEFGQNTTPTVAASVNSRCGADLRPVVATAYNASNARIGYLRSDDLNITLDSSIAVAAAWEVPATFSVTLTNAPAHATSAFASRLVFSAERGIEGSIDTFPGGLNGTGSLVVPRPPFEFDASMSGYIVQDPINNATQRIETLAATQAQTVVADVGADTLPWLSAAQATDQLISFTAGAGRPFDGVVANVYALEKGTTRATWIVVAPPMLADGQNVLALPTLPVDLADVWQPIDGVGFNVRLLDVATDSYAEFRQLDHVFTDYRTLGPALPFTVRESSLSFND